MRKAFGKKELKNAFEKIGEKLEKPVEAFLLGGGAMVFRDQKNATKDLDLVFESEEDCKVFSKAAEETGFEKDRGLEAAYRKMMAAGVWRNAGGFCLDLFAKTVCDALELNEKMAERSTVLGEFGRLTVKMVSNEDVILFKGITERPDDANDIAAIVRTAKIDWQTILDECKTQSRKRAWYGLLYDKPVEIEEKHGIDAPIAERLSKLDKHALLKEAYENRVSKGMTRNQALEDLKKQGFTKKELASL